MSINPTFRNRLLFLALITVMFASCRKDCCDCAGSEMYSGTFCEDELPSGFTSWDGYKAALKAGGCTCN